MGHNYDIVDNNPPHVWYQPDPTRKYPIANVSYSPLASSMLAPGVPEVMAEFKVDNNQLATFVVSVFVLGYASGPLLIAPLSELYGRTIIYHVCNALFTIFTIACALASNMNMLIGFRFLAGFAGVAVITCGSGTIADLMPPEQRGGAMAIWTVGPLLGPVIGPVCAGFLVEAKGWRWVFWVISMAVSCSSTPVWNSLTNGRQAGTVTLAALFVLKETYPPVLLERKAARLRKETGDPKYESKLKRHGTPRQIFIAAIVRPSRMFIFSPTVMAACVYVATIYGLIYILFTTFAFVYEEIYGFTSRGAGLSFIAGGIGNLLGLAYVGTLSDRIIRRRTAQGKTPKPEDRLHLVITVPSALTLPLGLIMYGWTADKHTHWIWPMVGTGVMGFGMIGIFMTIQTYLVDAYTIHAASVTAANTVLRSLLGALLPLCGLQLYDAIGLGWGNTLLGMLALILAPVPWLFAKYGERIRTSPRFINDF